MHSRLKPYSCFYTGIYVNQVGLATMLAARRSAGATTEVNQRSSLHADDEVCKQGAQSGFKTQDRLH